MRIVITAIVTAAIAALAFSADAATPNKKKQKHMAKKERAHAQGGVRDRTRPEFGYDSTPEHYLVGSREWWRAMEREGRGGFVNSP